MLTAVVLKLYPRAAVTAPAFLGRAAHAWMLQEVRRVDPALFTALHDADARKPFTAAPLRCEGARPHGDAVQLHPDRACYLRFTGLVEPVSDFLAETLPDRCREATVTLAGAPFRVAGVTTRPKDHPRAAQTTYRALIEEVDRTAPPGALTLRFLSPTAFRRSPPKATPFTDKPYVVPFPLPELVFENLLALWNAFAPERMPEQVMAYTRDCVVVSRHRLETVMVKFGGGRRGSVGGFVGECRYACRCGEPALARCVHILAAFAPFAGVGWRTTMGLGQVARVA